LRGEGRSKYNWKTSVDEDIGGYRYIVAATQQLPFELDGGLGTDAGGAGDFEGGVVEFD